MSRKTWNALKAAASPLARPLIVEPVAMRDMISVSGSGGEDERLVFGDVGSPWISRLISCSPCFDFPWIFKTGLVIPFSGLKMTSP